MSIVKLVTQKSLDRDNQTLIQKISTCIYLKMKGYGIYRSSYNLYQNIKVDGKKYHSAIFGVLQLSKMIKNVTIYMYSLIYL